jgi:hypothetical protein
MESVEKLLKRKYGVGGETSQVKIWSRRRNFSGGNMEWEE